MSHKPVTKKEFDKVVSRLKGVEALASHHDPEHHKWISNLYRDANILFRKVHDLQSQLDVVQRQMERIGAPLYRRKSGLVIQRVKQLPEPDYKLRSVK